MKKIAVYLMFAGTIACISIGVHVNAASEKKADQKEQQELTIDVYPTYGPYGAIRKAEYFPGEQLYLSYKVTGLAIDSDERSNASAEFKMYNEKQQMYSFDGGSIHFDGPYDFGNNAICYDWSHRSGQKMSVAIPLHAPAGKYRLEVVVQDFLGHKKKAEDFLFNVLPEGTFGAANLQLCCDPYGEHPVGLHGTVGQMTYITCLLVGNSVVDGQMHVRCSWVVKTEDGTPIIRLPNILDVNHAADVSKIAERKYESIALQLLLTKTGRFLLEVELEDLLAKDKPKALYKIPLVVVAPWEDMNVGENKKVVSQKTE